MFDSHAARFERAVRASLSVGAEDGTMPVREFAGFDHIDVRVRSLATVEPFYDRLLPELGLVGKEYSRVDSDGNWHAHRAGETYNVAEYFEPDDARSAPRFIGFIEDPAMQAVATRIAFAVPTPDDVRAFAALLREIGALAIAFEDDFDAYPAVFFEDPVGTRLEICARRPRVRGAGG